MKIEQLNKNNISNESIVVSSGELSQIAIFLLKKKAHGLLNGVFLPDTLIANIDSFVVRNNNGVSEEEIHTACPKCLKAFALFKAKENGLDPRSIDYVKDIFEGEVGHEGYYLDEEELISIQN